MNGRYVFGPNCTARQFRHCVDTARWVARAIRKEETSRRNCHRSASRPLNNTHWRYVISFFDYSAVFIDFAVLQYSRLQQLLYKCSIQYEGYGQCALWYRICKYWDGSRHSCGRSSWVLLVTVVLCMITDLFDTHSRICQQSIGFFWIFVSPTRKPHLGRKKVIRSGFGAIIRRIT